jgi:DNA-binding LacI/PurR family transcriptional regulator
MHIPSDEMGRIAAEFLVAQLNHDSVPEKIRLEASLIVRKTTAPL